jgi:hypothetical protein
MGVCLWAFAAFMPALCPASSLGRLVIVTTGIGAGIFIYGLCAYMLKSPELKEILTIAGKG